MHQGQTESKIKCPKCETLVDGFSGISEEGKPSDGDISICFYCACIGKYAKNVTVIEPMSKEALEEFRLESPEFYVQVMVTVKRIESLIYSKEADK